MHVVAVGSIYFEVNATIDNTEFTPGIEENLTSFTLTLGGSAAYFAEGLTKLGEHPSIIAKVGVDSQAEVLLELCRNKEINPILIKDPLIKTNTAINVSSSTSSTIMGISKSASLALQASELDTALSQFPQINLLYLSSLLKTPHLFEFWTSFLPKLKRQGTLIALDYGRSAVPLSKTIAIPLKNLIRNHVDILLPSRDDRLGELLESETDDLTLLSLANKEFPNTITILKQDKDGASTIYSGTPFHASTTPLSPLNSVGAGDYFNAAFLKSYLKLKNLHLALESGNRLAYQFLSTNH